VSQVSAGMHDATHSRIPPHLVDNADWLKTAAIIFVAVGHFGFFSWKTSSGGVFSDALQLRPSSSLRATRRPGLSRFTGYGSASF
jgi:hypothetical protein